MKLKDLVTLYFKSSLILLASPCVSRTPPPRIPSWKHKFSSNHLALITGWRERKALSPDYRVRIFKQPVQTNCTAAIH